MLIDQKASTLQIILIGLALAFISTIPYYNWLEGNPRGFIDGFPIGWLSAGIGYMGTFFHEIGHTLAAWFYGYPTIPIFDFKHGGGYAVSFSGQQTPILVAIWAAIGYGIYFFKDYRLIQIALGLLLIFNLSLAFNDYHQIVINFLGPMLEPLIAGFFLYRAFMDLAPRGDFERYLNSFFGFALIFKTLLESYSLLHNNAFRQVYYEQKGMHGFGDFDKIANQLPFGSFDMVVIAWGLIGLICFAVPTIIFIKNRHYI